MAISLNDSIRVHGSKHVDDKRLNNGQPYTSVSQVLSLIILTDRTIGQEVVITIDGENKVYWWIDTVLDGDLVEKVEGASPSIESRPTIIIKNNIFTLVKMPENNAPENSSTLEINDIVANGYWSSSTFWLVARYLGGDITLPSSWQVLSEIQEIPGGAIDPEDPLPEPQEPVEIVEYGVTGDLDGVNTIFTASNNFITNSLKLYHNGLRMFRGRDYTETSANSFTFSVAPEVNSNIIIEYMKP